MSQQAKGGGQELIPAHPLMQPRNIRCMCHEDTEVHTIEVFAHEFTVVSWVSTHGPNFHLLGTCLPGVLGAYHVFKWN